MSRWRMVAGFAVGLVLGIVGFGLSEWRWWVVMLAVAVSNEVAYNLGRRDRKLECAPTEAP